MYRPLLSLDDTRDPESTLYLSCLDLRIELILKQYTFDVDRDVVQGASDIDAFKAGESKGHPDEITRVAALQNNEPQLEIPKASWADFIGYIGQWKNGKVLLGTAGSWFLLDVAFYGKILPVGPD